MKNLLPKLQQYITIIGVITAIGGGFYTWGQFNLRLDNIEKKIDRIEQKLDQHINFIMKVYGPLYRPIEKVKKWFD